MGSSQSNTDKRAQWETYSKCECGDSYYMLKQIRWIEVPMWNEVGRAVVNLVLGILSVISFGLTATFNGGLKDPTHDAIECNFQCEKCSCNWWMTFEMSLKNKLLRFGRYTVQYGTKRLYPKEKSYV